MWVLFPGDPPAPVQGKTKALTFPQNMSTWMGVVGFSVAQGVLASPPRSLPKELSPTSPADSGLEGLVPAVPWSVSHLDATHLQVNTKSATTLAGRTPSVRTVAVPAWRGSPHQQKGAENQPQNRAVPCAQVLSVSLSPDFAHPRDAYDGVRSLVGARDQKGSNRTKEGGTL